MSALVPSQIVQFIDNELAACLDGSPETGRIELHPATCGALNALLRLVEELPAPLLPRDPKTYGSLVLSTEYLRFSVLKAQGLDAKVQAAGGAVRFDGGRVRVIREALANCPDEVPARHSRELLFIKAADFRNALLIDLETTRSALNNGEWKAATVLAGSLVEALLLWAIQQKPSAEVQTACCAALAAGKLKNKPVTDSLHWVLHDMVEVAKQLTLIEEDTGTQVGLAKDFRNLIHPGRAIRTQQFCDRGTALATSAAVELVMRDLRARFP